MAFRLITLPLLSSSTIAWVSVLSGVMDDVIPRPTINIASIAINFVWQSPMVIKPMLNMTAPANKIRLQPVREVFAAKNREANKAPIPAAPIKNPNVSALSCKISAV